MLKKIACIILTFYSIITQAMDESEKRISDYISNPTITTIGRDFIFSMEYVDGISKKDIIETERYSNLNVLRILHKKNIVENIHDTGIKFLQFRELTTELHLPFIIVPFFSCAINENRIIIRGSAADSTVLSNPIIVHPQWKKKNDPLSKSKTDAILTVAPKNVALI